MSSLIDSAPDQVPLEHLPAGEKSPSVSAVHQTTGQPALAQDSQNLSDQSLIGRRAQVKEANKSLAAHVPSPSTQGDPDAWKNLKNNATLLSPPNPRMVTKLAETPLEISFNMEAPINGGNCNRIYLSQDGRFIFKPLPRHSSSSVGAILTHCPMASATILAQNTEFTYEVSQSVCEQFANKQNPFVKPNFGYSQEGIVGTAFPLVEGFCQFAQISPDRLANLSPEQWEQAIVDLQKIAVVCAITGQNDINSANIGLGSDGRIYVVDYDLCSPAYEPLIEGLDTYLDRKSMPGALCVELPPQLSKETISALKSGTAVAKSSAKKIFAGDEKIRKTRDKIKNTAILEPIADTYEGAEEKIAEATDANKPTMAGIRTMRMQGDILSGLDMSKKEDVFKALIGVSTGEPVMSLTVQAFFAATPEERGTLLKSISDEQVDALVTGVFSQGECIDKVIYTSPEAIKNLLLTTIDEAGDGKAEADRKRNDIGKKILDLGNTPRIKPGLSEALKQLSGNGELGDATLASSVFLQLDEATKNSLLSSDSLVTS
ncbi:MAG: hypothetical protein LBJ94_03510 [Puniceicoccales bacterium]|jgi:hypothetical protein|nr:hypothetical protein [Puniceicoccales bacterium]